MNAQMVEFSDQDLDVMIGVKQGSYRGVEMILVRNGQVIDSYGVIFPILLFIHGMIFG